MWRSVCCMNSPASESSTSRDVSSLLPAFAASRSQPPFSSGVGSGSGSEEEGPAPEPEPTPEEKGGWLLEAAKAGNKEETSRLVLDSEAGEFMQHTDRQGWTPLL